MTKDKKNNDKLFSFTLSVPKLRSYDPAHMRGVTINHDHKHDKDHTNTSHDNHTHGEEEEITRFSTPEITIDPSKANIFESSTTFNIILDLLKILISTKSIVFVISLLISYIMVSQRIVSDIFYIKWGTILVFTTLLYIMIITIIPSNISNYSPFAINTNRFPYQPTEPMYYVGNTHRREIYPNKKFHFNNSISVSNQSRHVY